MPSTRTRARACRCRRGRSRSRCKLPRDGRLVEWTPQPRPAEDRAGEEVAARRLSAAVGLKNKKPSGVCLTAFICEPDAGYSTSFSCVSSAAIRSERRKRRSLALISNGRRSAVAGGALLRRGHLRQRAGGRAIDESDDRLERHLQFESCGARALPARFDAGIFCDSGGNGVGELSGHPVHDVIHSGTSSPPPELGRRGVSPTQSIPGRAAETERQVYAY